MMIALWVLAVFLVLAGIAGTFLPALAGKVALVFAMVGIFIAAYFL